MEILLTHTPEERKDVDRLLYELTNLPSMHFSFCSRDDETTVTITATVGEPIPEPPPNPSRRFLKPRPTPCNSRLLGVR